jgi:hypothetical protein
LHLLGRVAGLLGLVEGLDGGLVVVGVVGRGGLAVGVGLGLAQRDVRLAEEERGQRAVGLLEVIDGGADVAEEVVGDAELEVDLLLLRPGGDREALGERVEDFFEVADLRPALGQPLAELAHHAAFEVLALHQERTQVDEGFGHDLTPAGRQRFRPAKRVGGRCDPEFTGRALPRVGRSREIRREKRAVPKIGMIATVRVASKWGSFARPLAPYPPSLSLMLHFATIRGVWCGLGLGHVALMASICCKSWGLMRPPGGLHTPTAKRPVTSTLQGSFATLSRARCEWACGIGMPRVRSEMVESGPLLLNTASALVSQDVRRTTGAQFGRGGMRKHPTGSALLNQVWAISEYLSSNIVHILKPCPDRALW